MDNNCCRVEINEKLISNAKEYLEKDKNNISSKAKILSLLGNEVRLKIIILFLKYESMCVCDLSDILQMKQSPISQHLRKLKDGGLLENKRSGMTIFYFIPQTIIDNIRNIIEG